MQPTLYEIAQIGSGRLAVMGRPRAGDWASDEFAGLAQLGVTEVVSLLESAEARELGLAEEAAYCEAAGIRFHSFPITDRGVPASSEDLSRLACRLYHSCAGGSFAAIHCRAGIGLWTGGRSRTASLRIHGSRRTLCHFQGARRPGA